MNHNFFVLIFELKNCHYFSEFLFPSNNYYFLLSLTKESGSVKSPVNPVQFLNAELPIFINSEDISNT